MPGEDRLHIIERLGAGARDISEQCLESRLFERGAKLGNLPQQIGTDRDSAGDSVPLLLLSGHELAREQGLLEPAENVGRKKVAQLDESIPVEPLAPIGGHGRGKAAAA